MNRIVTDPIEFISADIFDHEAGRNYIQPIIDPEEFWEDVGRIKYIKRLFNKYRQTGELKTTLIINHLIVLFNVFDTQALLRMLFFKFEGYHEYLKPFLIMIKRLPVGVYPYTADRPHLYTSDILQDEGIVTELRKILYHDNHSD